jgi:hypothetical protein
MSNFFIYIDILLNLYNSEQYVSPKSDANFGQLYIVIYKTNKLIYVSFVIFCVGLLNQK